MVDRNPASRWDEDVVIHGLTLFDIDCKPRKLDGKTTAINVPDDVIESLLSDNLKCGVCLGPLESTLTTTCLHRFCSECLQRALRMDLGPKMHHECPSCRAKLASRRASKADTKFDRLVQYFSGTKRAHSEMEENAMEVIATNGKRASSPRAGGSPQEESVDLKKYRDMHRENVGKFRELRAQKLLAAAARGNHGGSSGTSRKAMNATYLDLQQSIKRNGAANAASNPKGTTGTLNKVWLKLDPAPEWYPEAALQKIDYDESATANKARFELAHPFLRVPPYKNIQSLKTYLLQRLRLADELVSVEICGMFKNKMTVLDEALTVLDMTTKSWDAHSELVLYFRLKMKPNARA